MYKTISKHLRRLFRLSNNNEITNVYSVIHTNLTYLPWCILFFIHTLILRQWKKIQEKNRFVLLNFNVFEIIIKKKNLLRRLHEWKICFPFFTAINWYKRAGRSDKINYSKFWLHRLSVLWKIELRAIFKIVRIAATVDTTVWSIQ